MVSGPYGEPYLEHVAEWKPSGRTTPLGDNGGNGFECTCLARFALAGRFLGYATFGSTHEYQTADYSVARLNVQTGHREDVSIDPDVTSLNRRCLGASLKFTAHSGVTTIVATAAGTVAWIMAEPLPAGPSVVCEIPPGSNTPLVLAESKEIVPDSLALAPGRLYWIEGGVPRTVTIR